MSYISKFCYEDITANEKKRYALTAKKWVYNAWLPKKNQGLSNDKYFRLRWCWKFN